MQNEDGPFGLHILNLEYLYISCRCSCYVCRNTGLKFSIEQPCLLKYPSPLVPMELPSLWPCSLGLPPASEAGLFLLHQQALQRLPGTWWDPSSSEITRLPMASATILGHNNYSLGEVVGKLGWAVGAEN